MHLPVPRSQIIGRKVYHRTWLPAPKISIKDKTSPWTHLTLWTYTLVVFHLKMDLKIVLPVSDTQTKTTHDLAIIGRVAKLIRDQVCMYSRLTSSKCSNRPNRKEHPGASRFAQASKCRHKRSVTLQSTRIQGQLVLIHKASNWYLPSLGTTHYRWLTHNHARHLLLESSNNRKPISLQISKSRTMEPTTKWEWALTNLLMEAKFRHRLTKSKAYLKASSRFKVTLRCLTSQIQRNSLIKTNTTLSCRLLTSKIRKSEKSS